MEIWGTKREDKTRSIGVGEERRQWRLWSNVVAGGPLKGSIEPWREQSSVSQQFSPKNRSCKFFQCKHFMKSLLMIQTSQPRKLLTVSVCELQITCRESGLCKEQQVNVHGTSVLMFKQEASKTIHTSQLQVNVKTR